MSINSASTSDSTDHHETEAEITECPYPHCDSSMLSGEHDHSFCSDQCYWRSRALALFEDINYDSRFCNNCFRQLFDLVEPGRYMRSSKVKARRWWVHYPHRQRAVPVKSPQDPYTVFTEDDNRHAAIPIRIPRGEAIDSANSRATLSDTHPESDYTADLDTRPSHTCPCGAMDMETTVRPVKSDKLIEFAKRLSDAVETRYEEGEHDWDHDKNVMRYMTRERKTAPEYNDGTPDQHVLVNALADAIEAVDDNHS